MAKYSTPGIRFREIDNTIQTDSTPGLGIGAIVMKSNKGPVNQRIVTRNYSQFTNTFGEPENEDDYGHFAAENYFANSTQLFAVRATMGDEQYSQIQFCYPEASVTARNRDKGTAVFKYIDNQQDYQLKLLQPLSGVTNTSALCSNGAWVDSGNPYYLYQTAKYGEFSDILNETTELIVYKDQGTNIAVNPDVAKGINVSYPSVTTTDGSMSQYDSKLIFKDSAWESGEIAYGSLTIDESWGGDDSKGVKISFNIPSADILNETTTKVSFIGAKSAWSALTTEDSVAYKDIFTSNKYFFDPHGNCSSTWADNNINGYYGYTPAYKMNIIDWEDPETQKIYYIQAKPFTAGNDVLPDIEMRQAYGLSFTEYFHADESFAIISKTDLDEKEGADSYFASAVSAMYMNTTDQISAFNFLTPREVINNMMTEYGVNDITEINQYTYLRYYQVIPEPMIMEKVIKEKVSEDVKTGKKVDELKNKVNDKLFYTVAVKNTEVVKIVTDYNAEYPEEAIVPIQEGWKSEISNGDEVSITQLNNIVATPTSYLVNSVDKTYADGYTILTQSEDEPGNGDIEGYVSNFDNQLVIASIGPGKYGNDIGVSIITTACANIKALNHQNAFCWKDKYDDEDQVQLDGDDLTWKKVFRINVYAKTKTQTAAGAWGTGMDALLKDPIESWFVSTDPRAKDAEGNSLFAPTVINGHSEYIYISRSSVNQALNCKGEYEQPEQTYSIYQLTGGKNSTKNNIVEKTAALNFYSDRQKANFDILFNVDAIDTFNGRQRYNAHQRKIAEIAASRTMDIGVVQVTSKSAKTCKQMLSEAKMFSFNNGTYIAEYAGYDKYYNSTLAAWIYLPKSVAGACAMAYCDTFAYPWMAPAGVARGTINYSTAQLLRLTDDEIGQLYDNNVNSTRDCGSYGTVLWGQKTALKKNSLLNRINVRRCLNFIEKQLENMMTPYLFMQNSVNTRSAARNDIDSFLQRVQAAEGLDSYSLSVSQDAEDPTIMNVNIQLVPTSAIEFIDVKVVINRNKGVAVEEG